MIAPTESRREKVDMAVFAAVPGFVRVSVRLRDGEGGGPAKAARALLERTSANSSVATAPVGEARTRVGEAQPRVGEARPSDCPTWREAYSLVGLPPDTVPPHEALTAWAATPGGVPSQGLLLDVLNAFSLEHAVPVSAYDLAGASGDLWLRLSRGYELHVPQTGESPVSPPMGELILADSGDMVMARHWHGTAGRDAAVLGVPGDVLVHVDLLAPSASRVDALEDAVVRIVTGFTRGRADAQRLTRAEPVIAWAE